MYCAASADSRFLRGRRMKMSDAKTTSEELEKLADAQQAEMMTDALPSGAKIIASIPMDREILMTGLRGEALSTVPQQIQDIPDGSRT